MKLEIWEKDGYEVNGYKYNTGNIFIYFITKYFKIRWFTDHHEWFLYIHLSKRWWRFSGAGYMKGIGN